LYIESFIPAILVPLPKKVFCCCFLLARTGGIFGTRPRTPLQPILNFLRPSGYLCLSMAFRAISPPLQLCSSFSDNSLEGPSGCVGCPSTLPFPPLLLPPCSFSLNKFPCLPDFVWSGEGLTFLKQTRQSPFDRHPLVEKG